MSSGQAPNVQRFIVGDIKGGPCFYQSSLPRESSPLLPFQNPLAFVHWRQSGSLCVPRPPKSSGQEASTHESTHSRMGHPTAIISTGLAQPLFFFFIISAGTTQSFVSAGSVQQPNSCCPAIGSHQNLHHPSIQLPGSSQLPGHELSLGARIPRLHLDLFTHHHFLLTPLLSIISFGSETTLFRRIQIQYCAYTILCYC